MARGKKETSWLDRGLIFGPFVALCLSQEEFDRILIENKAGEYSGPFLNKSAAGTTHCFTTTETNKPICIVCIGNVENYTKAEVYALITHEAMHVWQSFCDYIGEDSPSPEFEAYSVQSLVGKLFAEYDRRRP
jgi:hypothetical protein